MSVAAGVAGCVDTLSLGPFVIYAPELRIPNLFSPNEDGVNDIFRIAYDGNESFFMQIFDRWGRPVFEGNQLGWNGINKQGSPAVEGVYYYVIKIGERAFKGNLTLLR